jgi:ribonuclease P protein component
VPLPGAAPSTSSPRSESKADFSFKKEVRLRRRSEFLRVQDKGHKLTADCLLCLVLPNARPDGLTRLGLTVSTKVGPSVVRNRIRRRLRELFRVRKASLPRGLDMVFIARSSAAEADWPRMVRAYERIERELGQKFGRPTK